MQCTEEQAYSYSETLEILSLIDTEYRNRIPDKLISILEDNHLSSYVNHITPGIPLENQELSEKTEALIALICLNYWCDSDNQKEDLKSIFDENEKDYQKSLINESDPYNLFGNNKSHKTKQNTQHQDEIIQPLPVEEIDIPIHKKIFSKIINYIKKYIKKGF